MSCVKAGSGFKIKLESGRLLPKIYRSLKACKIRITQMESHK